VVSTSRLDYNGSKAFCTSRGMNIGSVHSLEDADSLEHLVTEPTYLGATETDGSTGWGASGVWAWDDGTPWDFRHPSHYNYNVRFDNMGEYDTDKGQHDETHLAMVPLSWVGTANGSTYWGAAGEDEGCMDQHCRPGWHDWGNGEAILPVLCTEGGLTEVCGNMHGQKFSRATAKSCYLARARARVATTTVPRDCVLSDAQRGMVGAAATLLKASLDDSGSDDGSCSFVNSSVAAFRDAISD
jgi:hypothetical protein